MRLFIFCCLSFVASCNDSNPKTTSTNLTPMEKILQKDFDWQGHRGARGLRPENTIPAFIKALDYPVSTLELDVAISKDNEVIVSHEPWFNHAISSHPDGTPVTEADEKDLLIYKMSYHEIKKYDVGIRGNSRFPDHEPMNATKPSLADMVTAVDTHCRRSGRAQPNFDIEIKSQPDYYGKKTPAPKEYVRIVLQAIDKIGIRNRCNLQSFDINVLEEIHRQDAEMVVAYLIENTDHPKKNLEKLSFKPHIYSPYFLLLSKEIIADLHAQNIKVIPWTVNEKEQMHRMIEMGVDGIITDYPNFIEEVGAAEPQIEN